MAYINKYNIDYRINGFHKKATIKDNGDIDTVEYYENYDGNEFSNLIIKETINIERDENTKLPILRILNIKFYNINGEIEYEKNYTKYYTPDRAYAKNKESTIRVFNKASMYLYSQIGDNNAKDFLSNVINEVNLYKDQNRQPLINAITNSTEKYMTEEIKQILISMLNFEF